MSTLSQKFGSFILVPKAFYEASKNMSLSARWLFIALRSHADNDTDVAFPSYEKLREETGLSFSTIATATRELMASGWLERSKRFNGNNRYTLLYPSSPPNSEGLQKSKASPPKIEGQSSKNQSLTRLTKLDSTNIDSNMPEAPEQCTLPFAESDSEEKPTVRAADITEKGKKAKETPKPRERDLLFDAVAEVTLSNVTLQGSRIGKVTADLRKINATPEQVHQVATWFAENDWRAKAGGKLTFAILMEVWECGVKNVKMEVKKNGKMTLRAQVPEATDQERDIAREKAAARIAERRANGHVPLHERASVTGMEVGK